jgi:hypothetical protein
MELANVILSEVSQVQYSLCKNEYRIFKPVKITIRKGLGRKKKNRRYESDWVIIHIYMEML